MNSTITEPVPPTMDVPCPSWCSCPQGHDLTPELLHQGTWRRLHRGPVGSDGAGLGMQRHQLEVIGVDGQLRRGRVEVLVWDETTDLLVHTR